MVIFKYVGGGGGVLMPWCPCGNSPSNNCLKMLFLFLPNVLPKD